MKNEELEQIIEKSFCTEPDYRLSSDFANKVTRLISQNEESKTVWREYFYLTAVLISLIISRFLFLLFYRSRNTIKIRSFHNRKCIAGCINSGNS